MDTYNVSPLSLNSLSTIGPADTGRLQRSAPSLDTELNEFDVFRAFKNFLRYINEALPSSKDPDVVGTANSILSSFIASMKEAGLYTALRDDDDNLLVGSFLPWDEIISTTKENVLYKVIPDVLFLVVAPFVLRPKIL